MATNVTVESQCRAQQNSQPGEWYAGSAPAVNVQATVTEFSPGADFQLVITAIVARLAANTTAPSATKATLNLIFGNSGDPASLSWPLTLEAVAGDRDSLILTGLSIDAPPDTSVTLEFAAAGGANTFQSVTLTGWIKNQTPPD